jgi:hypothetical protein
VTVMLEPPEKAFIYKSDSHGDTKSPLSWATWERQRDVYQLAMKGDKSCIRLWNDFQAENPGIARVVIRDIETDKANAASANRHLDKVLVKSEKPKKPKTPKSAADRQEDFLAAKRRELEEKNLLSLAGMAISADPAAREAARTLINDRWGA